MKISNLIKTLQAYKDVNGDCNVKFNIPDLMQYDVDVNFFSDACRANNFETENFNIEVYKKDNLLPDTEAEYMRNRNPPTQG